MSVMTFDSPAAFARNLQRILDDLPAAEAAGVAAGGAVLLEEARALAAAQGGILEHHIGMSADASMAVIGVLDGTVQHPGTGQQMNIGEVATIAEFGEPGSPPNAVFAATAFRHGQAAALAVAEVVGRALAGEAVPLARAPGATAVAGPRAPIRRAGSLGRDIDSPRSAR